MSSWIVRSVIALALILVGFAGGVMVNLNFANEDSEEMIAAQDQIDALNKAQENAEARLWRLYRERTAYKEQLEAIASGEASSPPPATSSVGGPIGAGVHLVGEDIQPGEYDGEVLGEFCYWARLKATDGTVNAIIENGLERGAFTITVHEADRALELSGVVLTAR